MAALGYFLIWKEASLSGVLMTGAGALGLILLWIWLRPGRSEITAAEDVFKTIGNGRPTFLNIFSNY